MLVRTMMHKTLLFPPPLDGSRALVGATARPPEQRGPFPFVCCGACSIDLGKNIQ